MEVEEVLKGILEYIVLLGVVYSLVWTARVAWTGSFYT
jgi:hypothetical protein